MTKDQIYEARRQWALEIIASECKGIQADFAKRIGKDSSYVSRMLYPANKKAGKGIGEDVMRAITEAFPNVPPPENAVVTLFTRERRADDDVTALQIALESLAVAVLKTTRGAASAFLADLGPIAKRRKFSTEHAFLGVLSGIAAQVQKHEVEAASTRPRGGSGRRKRP